MNAWLLFPVFEALHILFKSNAFIEIVIEFNRWNFFRLICADGLICNADISLPIKVLQCRLLG